MGNYEIYATTWCGIKLEIRWCRCAEDLCNGSYAAHLEIKVQGAGTLPITSSGYHSHYLLQPTDVDRVGGPVAYVMLWLSEYGSDNEPRQLALF